MAPPSKPAATTSSCERMISFWVTSWPSQQAGDGGTILDTLQRGPRAQIGHAGITAAAEGKGRATCRSRGAVVVAIGSADGPIPRPVHV
eukprot:scaffold1288_cov212-Pinguiococcus_pyrenoidosus.AAC.1